MIAIIYFPLTCTLSTFSCCATSAPELKPPGSGTASDSWDIRRYKKNTKRQKTWSNDLQWKSLLHCFIQTLKLKRVPKKLAGLNGLWDWHHSSEALHFRAWRNRRACSIIWMPLQSDIDQQHPTAYITGCFNVATFPKGFKFQPSTPRKHLCLKRLGRWFQWSRSWGPWQQLRNVVVASLGSAAVQLPNESSTDFYESLHMFGFKKIQNLVPKKLGLPSIKETKQRWSCGWRKKTHEQGY